MSNSKATVINIREINNLSQWLENPNNIYIASPNFPLFNPYRIGIDGTRTEVINKYKSYIAKRISDSPSTFIPILRSLKGKTLGCCCHPLPCHGDVLINLVNLF